MRKTRNIEKKGTMNRQMMDIFYILFPMGTIIVLQNVLLTKKEIL